MSTEKHPLLHQYLEGELTPDEAAALDAWVRQSPENARACARELIYYHLTREHLVGRSVMKILVSDAEPPMQYSVLEEALALESAAKKRRQSLDAELMLQAQSEDAARREVNSLLRGKSDPVAPVRHIVIPRALAYGGFAAIVALVVFAWFRVPASAPAVAPAVAPTPEPPLVTSMPTLNVPHAHLLETFDARWAGEDLAVGASLPAGPLELVEGNVRIEFAGGARVALRGPVRFVVNAAGAMELLSGTVTGFCPPHARGFSVTTPTVEVVDLGTAFLVTAEHSGSTEVAVVTGAVQLRERPRDGATSPPRHATLGAGWSGRVDIEGRIAGAFTPLETRHIQLHQDMTASEYDRQVRALEPLVFLQFSDRGAALLTQADGDARNRVRVFGRVALGHPDPFGRAAAAQLDSSGHIKVELPADRVARADAWTVTGWVRIRRSNIEQVLWMRTNHEGALEQWALQALLNAENDLIFYDYSTQDGAFHGGSFRFAHHFGPMPENEWFHIACVSADNEHGRLYINGELVATTAKPMVMTSRIFNVFQIGGDSGQALANHHAYGFEGDIHGVALFDRALNDRAIDELFLAGQGSSSETAKP